MDDPDLRSLVKAATERQVAVMALQKKYANSVSIPTEQLVRDMREMLNTERVVLDAIITLFIRLGHTEPDRAVIPAPDVVIPAPDATPST